MNERFFGRRHLAAPLLSLAASAGTLICCVLPAVMVALGMGAALAGFLTHFPQLIWLSRHKAAVFGLAAVMIAIAGIFLWQARRLPCPADPLQAKACQRLRSASMIIYGVSVIALLAGIFFSFIAPYLPAP